MSGNLACGSAGNAWKKPSGKECMPKRQCKKEKMLKMKEKREVLDKLDSGMGPEAVGKLFNISESTVREIRMKREEIRSSLKDVPASSVIRVAHITHPISKQMITTEHYLKRYIDSKNDQVVWISSGQTRK